MNSINNSPYTKKNRQHRKTLPYITFTFIPVGYNMRIYKNTFIEHYHHYLELEYKVYKMFIFVLVYEYTTYEVYQQNMFSCSPVSIFR